MEALFFKSATGPSCFNLFQRYFWEQLAWNTWTSEESDSRRSQRHTNCQPTPSRWTGWWKSS